MEVIVGFNLYPVYVIISYINNYIKKPFNNIVQADDNDNKQSEFTVFLAYPL